MDGPASTVTQLLPEVHFRHSSVGVRDVALGNISGIAFDLPYNNCSLVWLQWPEHIPKPVFDAKAGYNDIFVHGKDRTQPRRTLCYGESYRYSGTDHKLEPTTPKDIALIMETTLLTCDPEKTLPISMMCLANWYQTGHHHITSHSDKEGQSSQIKDVWCWVIGQTRRLVIHSRKEITQGKRVKLLCVSLPEGIYIMQGDLFQKTYKHEIPQEKEAMFKRLCKVVPPELPFGYEEKQRSLYQADWLAANPEVVRQTYPRDYRDYVEWAKPRYSYTIRFFTAEK